MPITAKCKPEQNLQFLISKHFLISFSITVCEHKERSQTAQTATSVTPQNVHDTGVDAYFSSFHKIFIVYALQ